MLFTNNKEHLRGISNVVEELDEGRDLRSAADQEYRRRMMPHLFLSRARPSFGTLRREIAMEPLRRREFPILVRVCLL